MKKLKIFPKMFIQIFSVLGIIIILVHLLVYFIFPKTYLETRKEKIHNIADEISGNMNGKEMKYIEQTLELYSKSSEIKAFIKEKNNKNEIQIKDDINVNLEREKMLKLREELLAVEEDRMAGRTGTTVDELDAYLDDIIEEV